MNELPSLMIYLISEITVSRKRGWLSVFAAAVQCPEVVRWWCEASTETWLLIHSSFRRGLVLAHQQLHFLLIYAGIGALCLLFLLRDAGAAHGDGDVILGIDVAAPGAGGRAAQDDRGHEHRGAAEVQALLAKDAHQAAFAQAVGFGNVLGVSCGIIGNPRGKQIKIH